MRITGVVGQRPDTLLMLLREKGMEGGKREGGGGREGEREEGRGRREGRREGGGKGGGRERESTSHQHTTSSTQDTMVHLVGVCTLVVVDVPHRHGAIIVTGCHLVLEIRIECYRTKRQMV